MAQHACAPYIAGMDLAQLWDRLGEWLAEVPQSGLLLAALGAMLFGVIGSFVIRRSPGFGRLLRGGSTLALMGILVLVVMQLGRFDPRFDMAVPQLGLPQQVVEGGETRVQLASDGHYWVTAQVNGAPAKFLVDTGATITAVSTETAERAGLEPRRGGMAVRMQTANGAVAASLTSIEELRFGNVAARGLDAVIAPNIGPTNVLGMNLLSRLASWRVEEGVLVLVPHHPQETVVEAVER
jgi:aspartyl protease family protein